MNRFWQSISGIDRSVPITPSDEKAILSTFKDDEDRGHRRHPIRVYLVPLIPAVIVFMLGLVCVTAFRWPGWTFFVFFALAVVLQVAGYYWSARSYFGPLFRKEARNRGYDVCIDCGYWLRGLNDDIKQCPECGWQREGLVK